MRDVIDSVKEAGSRAAEVVTHLKRAGRALREAKRISNAMPRLTLLQRLGVKPISRRQLHAISYRVHSIATHVTDFGLGVADAFCVGVGIPLLTEDKRREAVAEVTTLILSRSKAIQDLARRPDGTVFVRDLKAIKDEEPVPTVQA